MKRKFIIISVIVILLAGLLSLIYRRLPIISGFAAKDLCSNIFVANREADSIKANDIDFVPVSWAKSVIDYKNKTVTSTIFGLSEQKAVYREGCGCTLLGNGTEEELKSHPFHQFPASPENPDTILWPFGNMLTDTVFQEIDQQKLQMAVDSAFDFPYGKKYKKTLSVIVLYKGQVVAEKYAPGINENTPLLGWSMNKTIANALVGILVKQGKLDVHAPVDIPEWQSNERKLLTLNYLLQMESGLKWRENYFDRSDATKLLYMEKDVYGYAISKKLQYKPGTHWEYSSGTSNIISGIIRNTLGNDSLYHIFPRKALFNKIGMTSAILETDVVGTFVSSSYGFATTRDWARFGLLYLNKGKWNGEQIFPDGWVQYSVTPNNSSKGWYGAQIWLNKGKRFPDVPDDAYGFHGFQGQRVIVIPSKDLVAVRMGLSSQNFDTNRFLKDLIASIEY